MKDLLIYFVLSFLFMATILFVGPQNVSVMPLLLGVSIGIMYKIRPIYAISYLLLLCALYVFSNIVQISLTQLEEINPTQYPAEKHNIILGAHLVIGTLVLSPVSYALGKAATLLFNKMKRMPVCFKKGNDR